MRTVACRRIQSISCVLAIVLALMFLGVQELLAGPVKVETARLAAERWTSEAMNLPPSARAFVATPPADLDVADSLYFFELQPQGLVVVAADDAAHPVLFYTDQKVDLQGPRPPQFDAMIRGAVKHIRAAKAAKQAPSARDRGEWDRLAAQSFTPQAISKAPVVGPLTTTLWDQGQYYNAMCPADNSSKMTGYDGKTCVGCVAVSMSQVMRFHRYPARGIGSHAYVDPIYGPQFADFGATIYNWSDMPNQLTDYTHPDVPQLLYQAGVSVNMSYGIAEMGGSGAYQSAVRDALVNNFGYSSAASYVQRALYRNSGEWTGILRSDLDRHKPIVYGGSGPMGGHSFVLDGYSEPNYFHINWGWSGQYNGYFYLDDLTPAPLIDPYENFNAYQDAVIHITPPVVLTGDDLIAHRAFLSSDPNGLYEVTGASAGQVRYFCVEFSLQGDTPISGCWLTMNLDGQPYAAGQFDIPVSTTHWILVAGPWTATQGSHTQSWLVDSDMEYNEPNETNNETDQTFAVGASPSPNLVAQRVFVSASPTGTPEVIASNASTPLYFFAQYAWTGVTPTAANVSLKLDGTPVAQGLLNISADVDRALVGTAAPWAAVPGDHTLTFDLDTNNAVAESDESDNSAQAAFTVTSFVTNPDAHSSWAPGQRYWIMWNAEIMAAKQVRVDLYRDGALYSPIKKKTNNKGSLKFRTAPLLPPGNTYQVVVSDLTGSGRQYQSAMFSIGMAKADASAPAAAPAASNGAASKPTLTMHAVPAVTEYAR